jgi:hypothetical protein
MKRYNQQQARKGDVYKFFPDKDFQCCGKKNCSQHFQDAKNHFVVEARLPLFDGLLSRSEMRCQLADNWDLLKLPSGERCCKEMMLRIYNCSSSLIYGDGRRGEDSRSQGDANSAQSQKAKPVSVCIAAWFFLLIATSDCMPDGAWYQLNIPQRSMVRLLYFTLLYFTLLYFTFPVTFTFKLLLLLLLYFTLGA